MCARFSLIVSPHQFQMLFGVEPEDLELKDEFFPTDTVPGVVFEPETGHNALRSFRWGLVPPWADDLKIGQKMFNARAETLLEKRSFRQATLSQRCVLPASCFYEWPGGVKSRISLPDDGLFAFAGLWERWNDIETCTLITCEPSPTMAKVHNRMPVIFRPSQIQEWLSPGPPPLSLLRPFEGELKIAAEIRQPNLFD